MDLVIDSQGESQWVAGIMTSDLEEQICCGTLILMGVPQALQVYLSVGGFAMAYGGYRWGVAS